MAIKTFATGEVLTASDTNTYLANSGLVYVTSTTIGSAVSSVTISNVFSSTYDNYQILITDFSMSSASNVEMQLRAGGTTSTTAYYWAGIYMAYTSSTVNGENSNNGSAWVLGFSDGSDNSLIFDVAMPYTATQTHYTISHGNPSYFGTKAGYHATTSSYTDFVLKPASGTMTGGTITVYGYRKA